MFISVWQLSFGISNAAITVLLAFLQSFFNLITLCTAHISSSLLGCPKTQKTAQKIIGFTCPSFERYVVCPKCNSIYNLEDCIIVQPGGKVMSATCKHLEYPNHPQAHYRKPCGFELLRAVKRHKSKASLEAKKQYCYQHLNDAIGLLINRPDFLSKCEQWRNTYKDRDPELLTDIYDGRIWEELQTLDGKGFLSLPNNLALGLGCDWFQPYKHVTYSIGVLFLVIFNLPRKERFKMENVILLGLIPGASEPKKVMNSYIGPFVQDLLEFWEGIMIWSNLSQSFVKIRLALICVMCDIPATRKVCGFAGHSATHGCSKCLKEFNFGICDNKLDYSGYDRDSWELRTKDNYNSCSEQYLKAPTKTMKQKVVSDHGVRYSILTQLPYFNIVRMHVIDPMHNILLGTPKHIMNIWIEQNILSKAQLNNISSMSSKINVPRSIGRLPSKIASSFSGFTADQWKNWVTVYSAVCLKDQLPKHHFQCWLLFVRACSILVKRTILKHSVVASDEYLVQFCKSFENLYGAQHCTINLHLHLHLKEVILDYGPVYGFWCFSFERFNGTLGDYFTNNNNIEMQFMKKFLMHQHSSTLHLSNEYEKFLVKCREKSTTGSILQGTTSAVLQRALAFSPMSNLTKLDYSICTKSVGELLPPISTKYMQPEMIEQLTESYKHLYIEFNSLLVMYNISSRASIAGHIVHSISARTDKGSVVFARWPLKQPDGLHVLSGDDSTFFGVVQYFVEHTVSIGTTSKSHLFALVKWAKPHSQYDWFGQSATVCEKPSISCFIPIQRILGICAHANLEVQFNDSKENVSVLIPSISFV